MLAVSRASDRSTGISFRVANLFSRCAYHRCRSSPQAASPPLPPSRSAALPPGAVRRRFPREVPMSDWLINLPVVWMAVVMLLLTYLLTAAIYMIVTRLAVGERARAFKGVSAAILSPLAVLFALLVGFLAAQVWSDADRSRTAVNQEASSLRAVVLLAAAFPGAPETRLRELVRDHIANAVTKEWPAMASHNATLTLTSPPLAEALRTTLALDTKTAGQATAQREIVVALDDALAARRQRIILSQSVVNWVKWT